LQHEDPDGPCSDGAAAEPQQRKQKRLQDLFLAGRARQTHRYAHS
jgi:hypothetical protein